MVEFNLYYHPPLHPPPPPPKVKKKKNQNRKLVLLVHWHIYQHIYIQIIYHQEDHHFAEDVHVHVHHVVHHNNIMMILDVKPVMAAAVVQEFPVVKNHQNIGTFHHLDLKQYHLYNIKLCKVLVKYRHY